MEPLPPFGDAWLVDYFQMVDRLDPDEFVTWYADDCLFRFGNAPAVQGKPAIVAMLSRFYALITALHHEKTGCWTDADSGVFEALAHFEALDGSHIVLPAMTSLRIRGGKITALLMVMDASPLLSTRSGDI